MIGKGKLKLHHENHKLASFQLIKRHNSVPVTGIIPKGELDLYCGQKHYVSKHLAKKNYSNRHKDRHGNT